MLISFIKRFFGPILCYTTYWHRKLIQLLKAIQLHHQLALPVVVVVAVVEPVVDQPEQKQLPK